MQRHANEHVAMAQLVKHAAIGFVVVTGKQALQNSFVILPILFVKMRQEAVKKRGMPCMRVAVMRVAWMHDCVPSPQRLGQQQRKHQQRA